MSILNSCVDPFAKSLLRGAHFLTLVLLCQAATLPLMGGLGSPLQQFPQVVLNGGSTTTFLINNPSTRKTVTVTVQLYRPDGTALAAQQVELLPGTTQTVVFGDPQAGITRGWAELKSDDDFIATEFFQLFAGGPRTGVLPSPFSEEIRFFGFINDHFRSGLAVHNPSPTESTQVTLRVTDMAGEQPVSEKILTLTPRQSESAFLNEELFFGEGLSEFEGVVEISVNSPGVAVLSLIQEASGEVATVAVEAQSFVATGETNTSLGRGALVSITDGMNNTASGFGALSSNTVGSDNTASGVRALFSNTEGNFNTASGRDALFSNTTGNDNTANGSAALSSNKEGIGNTATGNAALLSNTTGSFNTASGNAALFSNTTASNNTASGVNALSSSTTGSGNTATGFESLASNTTGFNNTTLGFRADVSATDLTNATAIGASAIVDASNKIRLGDSNVTVIEGQVGYTFSSDKTKKENFRSVDGEPVLSKLRSLESHSWNYIGHDPNKLRHYGPMAQDFFAAFGQDGVGTIGTETTINTGDLAGILMIAVQALERRTAENLELKERLEELERAVQKLVSGLAAGRNRSTPSGFCAGPHR